MSQTPTNLYLKKIPDLNRKLAMSLEQGNTEKDSTEDTMLFFRADDIGVPSPQFQRLLQLFTHHKAPLSLATVPTWMTESRREVFSQLTEIQSSQWCWHQHGWLHRNHELTGKKQEFGPSRSHEAIHRDLQRGKRRLQDVLGSAFFPFFTPPWNRCGKATITALKELRFLGLSRSLGAHPVSPSDFTDIAVNVDLHTRKETSQEEAMKNLLKELSVSIASGISGIMIHHQRMNEEAFRLLDLLLTLINGKNNIRPIHFRDFF